MALKTLLSALLVGSALAFAPRARIVQRSTALHIAINGPEEAQRLAQECMQGGCDVYERDAVVKHLLQTKRELKAEISNIDATLRDLGYLDDEDNFFNFVAAAVMRNFGGAMNEAPPANTDGHATGYSGDKRKKRKWGWDF